MNVSIDLPDGWEVNDSFESEENFIALQTTDGGGHIDIFPASEGVTLQLRTVDDSLSTWVQESRQGVAEHDIQERVEDLVSVYHDQYEEETHKGE